VQTVPYRWQLSGSFVAHLWKAATQQHHLALASTIARFVGPEAVVFDVGSHSGQFTKLFARFASHGRVYAVEPGSYARSILRGVVWLRGLSNVTVLPVALGSASHIDVLTVPIKNRRSFGFGLAHLGHPEPRWEGVAQEPVVSVSLDALASALGLDRLDFIKADIEGWELQMLFGARHSLEKFRPVLLLELTGAHLARAGHRLDDAFAFLRSCGYRAFELSAEGQLSPVDAPRDGDFWFLPADKL
jgi:FkbM family methyltransferase